jgi:hypothetical protein
MKLVPKTCARHLIECFTSEGEVKKIALIYITTEHMSNLCNQQWVLSHNIEKVKSRGRSKERKGKKKNKIRKSKGFPSDIVPLLFLFPKLSTYTWFDIA